MTDETGPQLPDMTLTARFAEAPVSRAPTPTPPTAGPSGLTVTPGPAAAPRRRSRRVPERDWLEQAFRHDYPQLVRLATYLVDRDVAEEIVQDAFVRTHGRLHGVDPDKVSRDLRAAVVNGARSHLRRRFVQRRHAPSPAPPAAAAEVEGVGSALRTELLAHLDRLPLRQREVLLLRYFVDLSEQEIAETLGVSKGTVKQHAYRGLAALASVLEVER